MKALLKTGEWVDIDTKYLFHDQYNTTDGKRIFDKDISRIVNDIRENYGICKYCGALIKRGEEEKHFTEKESKTCNGCFWYRNKLKDTRTIKKENEVINDNGEMVETEVITTISTYTKVCSYAEKYGGCTNKECRRMGIDWFTKENTFFLKYPNGFDEFTDLDKLKVRGFVFDDRLVNAHYYKKIGSYTLSAQLKYDSVNKKIIGVSYFHIYNSRNDYQFRFEKNGELFTNKYSFGWRKVETLEKVPVSVMEAIKKICIL